MDENAKLEFKKNIRSTCHKMNIKNVFNIINGEEVIDYKLLNNNYWFKNPQFSIENNTDSKS